MARTPLAESLIAPLREALETIDSLMSIPEHFDPELANRTFTMVASEYVSAVLLNGVMAHLQQHAPGIRINITSVSARYADHLRRAEATFAVMPQEVMDSAFEFSAMPLFEDSYVALIWTQRPESGERLTRQQMSELPYVKFDPPGQVSIVDKQLDDYGIERNAEVSTTSMLAAPFLIPGTRLFAMIQRRLAEKVVQMADVRIVQPAVQLSGLHENLYWPRQLTNDPGHRWLREQVAHVAAGLRPEYQ